jgi:hypothetical protein
VKGDDGKRVKDVRCFGEGRGLDETQGVLLVRQQARQGVRPSEREGDSRHVCHTTWGWMIQIVADSQGVSKLEGNVGACEGCVRQEAGKASGPPATVEHPPVWSSP